MEDGVRARAATCSLIHAAYQTGTPGTFTRVRNTEERAPVGVAPGHVGAVVGDSDAAEELSVRADHVNSAGAGAVDVAFAVHFHAVGDAGLRHCGAGADRARI